MRKREKYKHLRQKKDISEWWNANSGNNRYHSTLASLNCQGNENPEQKYHNSDSIILLTQQTTANMVPNHAALYVGIIWILNDQYFVPPNEFDMHTLFHADYTDLYARARGLPCRKNKRQKRTGEEKPALNNPIILKTWIIYISSRFQAFLCRKEIRSNRISKKIALLHEFTGNKWHFRVGSFFFFGVMIG